MTPSLRYLLLSTLILGSIAPVAGANDRWRTPGGGLYFGSSPPPGSILADDVSRSVPSPSSSEALRPREGTRPTSEAPRAPKPAPVSAAPNRSRTVASVASPSPAADAFTKCLRNDGTAAERAWVTDDRQRFLLGVIHPGRVGCFSINMPTASSDERNFRIETEPVASRD